MFTLHIIVITTGVAMMLLINPAISCDYYDASSDGNFTATITSNSVTAPVTVIASVQNSEASDFCFYEENVDKPSCN